VDLESSASNLAGHAAARSGEVHVAHCVLVDHDRFGHGLKLGFLVVSAAAAVQRTFATVTKQSGISKQVGEHIFSGKVNF